jgi:flagellar biosynthesis protein FlhB
VGFLVDLCRRQLGGEPWLVADADFAVTQWNTTVWTLGRYLVPILGLLCLAAVAVNVLQVGFLFLPQRLAIDFARLNPIDGFRRIFSSSGTARLGFGFAKLAIVSAAAVAIVYNQSESLFGLTELAPAAMAGQMTQIIFWTAMKLGAALLVLALLDYAYQWWRHEQDLKMTPQELREELRNLEGNPQIVARRKQMQRELAQQRQKQ